MAMRGAVATAVLVALGSVTAGPLTEAQATPTAQHEIRLSILSYHPYPDRPVSTGGDPFGVPIPNGTNGTLTDWMALHYGAIWFPTTRFDGVLEIKQIQGAAPRQFYEAYNELYQERAIVDSPVVLHADGKLNGSSATAHARFVPISEAANGPSIARLVVFEDDIPYVGENKVPNHRFTVRAILDPRPVTLRLGQPVDIQWNFTVGTDTVTHAPWDTRNLGVVVYLQEPGNANAHWKSDEVLQSATYYYRQDGPTVQVQRAVLMETYTAVWCPSCVFGDGALDLLSQAYGVQSTLTVEHAWKYLRIPTWWQLALGLTMGTALAIALTPGAERLWGRR